MTLDEAIEHAKERAIFRDICGQEHSELANWLEELKELRDKYSKLEKEADWLAERMSQVCRDCGDMCYRGDLPVCPITSRKGDCRNVATYEWRKAARRAVEEQ